MARARRRGQASVSLFPFLSVLACVIGTLTLLITATAIGQVAADTVDLERYEKMEREIESSRSRLATLTALEAEAAGLARALTSARDAHAAIASAGQAARAALERSGPLRDTLNAAQDRVEALRSELVPLEDRLRRHARELEAKRGARKGLPIRIRPSGTGFGLEPYFVECRKEGIVLYEPPEYRPFEVVAHRITRDGAYRRFLHIVDTQPGNTVVYLIRPGGVGVYKIAVSPAHQLRVRNGEMPIPADGVLDFSDVGTGPRS